MERLVIGILAPVDAGKTSLSEALLYRGGLLRSPGRVDHRDSYLDTERLERERGITIFSKQAVFSLGEKTITLLDTPGHADFSAEMERALSVLDYAILLISGTDGVQGYTKTLFRLLESRGIPCFFFVNKMDRPGTDRAKLLAELRENFSSEILDFSSALSEGEGELMQEPADFPSLPPELLESISLTEESAMEEYLSSGKLPLPRIQELFRKRRFFPLFFGSALKLEGISPLLLGTFFLMKAPSFPASRGLSARVFKISRDEKGRRLSFLKLRSGKIQKRQELLPGEKITGIRLYSGAGYEELSEAEPGMLVALTGIRSLYAGQSIGEEGEESRSSSEAVLEYSLYPAEGGEEETRELYRRIRELSEEFPELHLSYDSELPEIRLRLMGEVQTEILGELIRERFGTEVRFGEGRILYRETIGRIAEGVGHFEPLRHYAEVHLLLEPLPRGSGTELRTLCPLDTLSGEKQRQILELLSSEEFPGVLGGFPITDLRISLLSGKASEKHTDGGDFREAAIRALRQGLRRAESLLLEPWYRYRMELPPESLGRAMTELSKRGLEPASPEIRGESAFLSGEGPLSSLFSYEREFREMSRGRGKFSMDFLGYRGCPEERELLSEWGYDPDSDLRYPSSSVFCLHGNSRIIPWDQVEKYMHLPPYLERERGEEESGEGEGTRRDPEEGFRKAGYYIGDQELEEIFVRTYGPVRDRAAEAEAAGKRTSFEKTRAENLRREREIREEREKKGAPERGEEALIVDGYNMIHAFPALREIAEENLDSAREKLLERLSNYRAYSGKNVILVFDAYRLERHPVETALRSGVRVVFTKEAQTADQYIEELSRRLSEEGGRVEVASGDRLVQLIAWSGRGVSILSAADLERELERVEEEIRREHLRFDSAPRGSLSGRGILPDEKS